MLKEDLHVSDMMSLVILHEIVWGTRPIPAFVRVDRSVSVRSVGNTSEKEFVFAALFIYMLL